MVDDQGPRRPLKDPPKVVLFRARSVALRFRIRFVNRTLVNGDISAY